MRAVLDTNVFVSMAFGGQVGKINDDWKASRFTEVALEGKADYIASGDSHLLALKAFRGMPILTAREFIERLESAA